MLMRSVFRAPLVPAASFFFIGTLSDWRRSCFTPQDVPEPNVLVVEDDDTIRRLLVEYLRSHVRIQVESARDGVEALHLISTRPWRVVLLDVMMPKMSGVDLLSSVQAFRADPSLQRM